MLLSYFYYLVFYYLIFLFSYYFYILSSIFLYPTYIGQRKNEEFLIT